MVDYVKKVDDNKNFYDWMINQPKFTQAVLPNYMLYNNFLNWFDSIVYNQIHKRK